MEAHSYKKNIAPTQKYSDLFTDSFDNFDDRKELSDGPSTRSP